MSEALNALKTLTSKLDEMNELNDALNMQFENYEDLSKINDVTHLKSQVTLASKIYSEMQKVEVQKNLLEKEAALIQCRVTEINFKRKNILSRIDKVKLEIDK